MNLNRSYVESVLNFHGQPLQKIWDEERGKNDLEYLGLANPNFDTYTERQKYFKLSDRRRRLNLNQFIARKAPILYQLSPDAEQTPKDSNMTPGVVNMPPYEFFVQKTYEDPEKILEFRLRSLKRGIIVYAIIAGSSNAIRIPVKALCTELPVQCLLTDVAFKNCYIPTTCIGALPCDANGKARMYSINEIVRCEVIKVTAGAELMLSIKSNDSDSNFKLGLVRQEDLPKYYKLMLSKSNSSYQEILEKSPEFENPDIHSLCELCGLNHSEKFTVLTHQNSYRFCIPVQVLRIKQTVDWAYDLVEVAIDYFKNKRLADAFRSLDQALVIDPENVEALVARATFYASKGSFVNAIEDFKEAISIDPQHGNGLKYMGEALVTIGQNFELQKEPANALKAYQDCLNIIPEHKEAIHLINTLKYIQKTSSSTEDGADSTAKTEILKASTDQTQEEARMRELYTAVLSTISSDDEKHDNSKKSQKSKKKSRNRNRDREDSIGDNLELPKIPQSLKEVNRRIEELQNRKKKREQRQLHGKKSLSPPRMIDYCGSKKLGTTSQTKNEASTAEQKAKFSFTIKRKDKVDRSILTNANTAIFKPNRSRSKSSTEISHKSKRRSRSRSRSQNKVRGKRHTGSGYKRQRSTSSSLIARKRSHSRSRNSSPRYAGRTYLRNRNHRRSRSPSSKHSSKARVRSRSHNRSPVRVGRARDRSRSHGSSTVRSQRDRDRSVSRKRRRCDTIATRTHSRSKSHRSNSLKRHAQTQSPHRISPKQVIHIIDCDEPDWDCEEVNVAAITETKLDQSDDDVIILS